jgi:membrane protein YdbS with pleckstrin-like domain
MRTLRTMVAIAARYFRCGAWICLVVVACLGCAGVATWVYYNEYEKLRWLYAAFAVWLALALVVVGLRDWYVAARDTLEDEDARIIRD